MSIRNSINHIHSMPYKEFYNLMQHDVVYLERLTEKVDGATFKIGYDKDGFYTQSSGSGKEKMRKPYEYFARAWKRATQTGEGCNESAALAFGELHQYLEKSPIKDYMAFIYQFRDDAVLLGEALIPNIASVIGFDKIRFVGTTYDKRFIGSLATFVIYSQVFENAIHFKSLDYLKSLSSQEMRIYDDRVQHKCENVDITDLKPAFNHINQELINARTTKKNKDAKEVEKWLFGQISNAVSIRVDENIIQSRIQPNWGDETEGFVVHPPRLLLPEPPRFKVTSTSFRKYRDANKSG